MIRSFILFLVLIFSPNLVYSEPEPSTVYHLKVDATINPAISDYISEGIHKAESDHASALVISLTTPGGLITAMQTIVEDILASKVPVMILVSPSGGGAISAGVFITLAGHIAAMAPGTTIGAAHPVNSNGDNIGGDMRSKAENFAATLIKAISEQRGRNMEWAEKAVRESVALTDSEAIKQKVVDYSANDVKMLLDKAKGRKIKLNGNEIILQDFANANVIEIPMSLKQKVVSALSDPNLMAILSLVAMGGIMAEIYHPGLIFPGLIGVISLILTLVASQVIPINVGGAILLLLGLVLITFELFIPSFGILGVAGIVCLILGSIYSIDTSVIWASQGFTFNPMLVGSFALLVGMILLLFVYVALKARSAKVVTGKEGLCEKEALVSKDFQLMNNETSKYQGKVQIMGEIWNATSEISFKKGDRVFVESVNGLSLTVKK